MNSDNVKPFDEESVTCGSTRRLASQKVYIRNEATNAGMIGSHKTTNSIDDGKRINDHIKPSTSRNQSPLPSGIKESTNQTDVYNGNNQHRGDTEKNFADDQKTRSLTNFKMSEWSQIQIFQSGKLRLKKYNYSVHYWLSRKPDAKSTKWVVKNDFKVRGWANGGNQDCRRKQDTQLKSVLADKRVYLQKQKPRLLQITQNKYFQQETPTSNVSKSPKLINIWKRTQL